MKCDWCPPKCYTKFPACFQLYSGRAQHLNPGNIQDLHARAHRIMPKFFDGLELDYQHHLAVNKVITANWMLSHTRPSGFRFGGIYTVRHHDDMLATPSIHADINPTTLASNVGIIYYPFQCFRLEGTMQRMSSKEPLITQFTGELMRPCATLTANLYNPSKETGRATLSFMRSISANWAMGAELLLEWTEPKTMMADTAFAARYARHNCAVAASASRQGLDVSYWSRLHTRIQMATMLAWHRKTDKTIATICYQWDFDDAQVRGMFDSDLSVGFMYCRSLTYLPCNVGMSLLISLPTNRFIFGLRFNLDPSGLRQGD